MHSDSAEKVISGADATELSGRSGRDCTGGSRPPDMTSRHQEIEVAVCAPRFSALHRRYFLPTDLDCALLLDAVFGLLLSSSSFRICCTNVELRSYGGAMLLKQALQVAEQDVEGVVNALNFRGIRPSLSLSDTFALALATGNR